MPNPRLAYKRILADCTRGCSLNVDRMPAGLAELVHRWFEEGCNDREIRERAAPLGAKLSNGAISRHRANHLHAADSAAAPATPGEESKPVGDLEVIENIIQAGARQVSLTSAKVTTEQLLRAIELKHRLTEGSVFDAMFEAMAGSGDDDLSDLEGDAAVRSDEERAQEAMSDGRTEGR